LFQLSVGLLRVLVWTLTKRVTGSMRLGPVESSRVPHWFQERDAAYATGKAQKCQHEDSLLFSEQEEAPKPLSAALEIYREVLLKSLSCGLGYETRTLALIFLGGYVETVVPVMIALRWCRRCRWLSLTFQPERCKSTGEIQSSLRWNT
jgi:hypothetical protein